MMNNPYQTYQNNSVNTASAGELTLMLYNGCLKFIKQGKASMMKNDIQAKNTSIQKAQNIISELSVTLNTDYEVAQDMKRMYEYMNSRLIEANVKNDTTILDEVSSYVEEYRDTWKEVIKLTRQKQFAAQGGQA